MLKHERAITDKWDSELIGISQCRSLSTQVHIAYDLSPVRVHEDDRTDRGSWFVWATRNITLPEWAMTRPVLLHEVAHSIIFARHGSAIKYHGGKYTATYLYLVHEICGTPLSDLIADAGTLRLEYGPRTLPELPIHDELLPRRTAA